MAINYEIFYTLIQLSITLMLSTFKGLQKHRRLCSLARREKVVIPATTHNIDQSSIL